MIKTSISAIIVFSVVVAALFFYFVDDFTDGLCSNVIVKEYQSPNKDLKAVIFQRDCGATTGSTTQISIIESDENLKNKAGNIFVIKGEPKSVAPQIEWNGNQELIIHYLPNGTESRAETLHQSKTPINITYR